MLLNGPQKMLVCLFGLSAFVIDLTDFIFRHEVSRVNGELPKELLSRLFLGLLAVGVQKKDSSQTEVDSGQSGIHLQGHSVLADGRIVMFFMLQPLRRSEMNPYGVRSHIDQFSYELQGAIATQAGSEIENFRIVGEAAEQVV